MRGLGIQSNCIFLVHLYFHIAKCKVYMYILSICVAEFSSNEVFEFLNTYGLYQDTLVLLYIFLVYSILYMSAYFLNFIIFLVHVVLYLEKNVSVLFFAVQLSTHCGFVFPLSLLPCLLVLISLHTRIQYGDVKYALVSKV